MKNLCQICLILLLMLWLAGCGKVEFLTSNGQTETEEQNITIKSPSLVMYKANQKDKVISGEEGKLLEKSQQLKLINFKSEVYEQGKYVAELSGKAATFFLQDAPKEGHSKNDIIVEGDVVYRHIDGTLLKTNELVWDNKKQLLTSESRYELQRPTENGTLVMSGKRFETDKAFKKWNDFGSTVKIVPKKK